MKCFQVSFSTNLSEEVFCIFLGCYLHLQTSSRPSTDLHDSLVDKSPSREIAAADILLESVEARDLVQFGLIPEFVGRFPVICALQSLSEDMLVRILDGPENSLLSQFRMLFRMEEVNEYDWKTLHK